jgi:hypothetical protein
MPLLSCSLQRPDPVWTPFGHTFLTGGVQSVAHDDERYKETELVESRSKMLDVFKDEFG